MSTRERWVVYPLLFLTLGTVMRDKFVPQGRFGAMEVAAQDITAHTIHCARLDVTKIDCREMAVSGPRGRQRVHIGSAPGGGGRLVVLGKGGEPAVVAGVDATGSAGSVQILNAAGEAEVQLGSTRAGGAVTTVRRDKKVWLVLGYEGPYDGVFAESPELGHAMSLTLPWRFPAPPAPENPAPESPAPGNPAPQPPTQERPSDEKAPDGVSH